MLRYTQFIWNLYFAKYRTDSFFAAQHGLHAQERRALINLFPLFLHHTLRRREEDILVRRVHIVPSCPEST